MAYLDYYVVATATLDHICPQTLILYDARPQLCSTFSVFEEDFIYLHLLHREGRPSWGRVECPSMSRIQEQLNPLDIYHWCAEEDAVPLPVQTLALDQHRNTQSHHWRGGSMGGMGETCALWAPWKVNRIRCNRDQGRKQQWLAASELENSFWFSSSDSYNPVYIWYLYVVYILKAFSFGVSIWWFEAVPIGQKL